MIGIFVALVSVLTVVIFVSRLGAFEWPWELKWAQTVPLEILNFAVIAAVCIIWRPTERSKLLSMHQQLPTGDMDADDDGLDDGFGGGGGGGGGGGDLENFGDLGGDEFDDLDLREDDGGGGSGGDGGGDSGDRSGDGEIGGLDGTGDDDEDPDSGIEMSDKSPSAVYS